MKAGNEGVPAGEADVVFCTVPSRDATADFLSMYPSIRIYRPVHAVDDSSMTKAGRRFRDGRDSRPFCEALAAAGVLVAPRDCFAMPDHMRVGFAVLKAERFVEALAIFENTLREH